MKTDRFATIAFSHAFQPIIDTEAGLVVSHEVLLRGKLGEPPATVFSQVNQDDLLEFDQASREQALSLAARLGLDGNLNLNFSPPSILFEGGRYIERTIEVANGHRIDVSRLVVEITESEVIGSMAALLAVANKLRRTGLTIAIDDFGAGYAGLNMLADLQPDMIKLDMHLIRDIDRYGPRQSIVRAIGEVSLDLGIEVLAEGVESPEEFRFLRGLGITLYQGYFFAPPGFECLPPVSDRWRTE